MKKDPADQLRVLCRRPDFQQNPARALFRRLRWRLRWRLNGDLWPLKIGNDLKIDVPRCGAGALIYYQGQSEPETARFVLDFLRPGMVFFDAGAHIGEYTLLASGRVGSSGEVHAFEPQPDTFELLRKNVEANGLGNVKLNGCALSDRDEEVNFTVRSETSLSSMAGKEEIPGRLKVPARTLDSYCRECGCRPDLIKIDVEGAELLVLRGAEELLTARRGRPPCLVFEYDEHNYSRFGYGFRDIRTILSRAGYRLFRLDPQGRPESIDGHETLPESVRNIVALN